MATAHEEYLAAYVAWKAKTDAYRRTLDLIISGGPSAYDPHAMKRETDELDRLHKDFMAKAKPFMYPKDPV